MLHNIQHTSGNRPLKGPLGSADKYTTLLSLACRLSQISTSDFFVQATFC